MTVGPIVPVAGPSFGDYGAVVASSALNTKIVAWYHTFDVLGGKPLEVDLDVQRFDTTGHRIGGVVTVASSEPGDTTNPTNFNGPIALAADGEGDVVIAWSYLRNNHSNIYAVELSPALQLTHTFTVAAYTTSWANSTEPSVAMASTTTSGFVISYTAQYGPQYYQTGVYANRYDSGAHLVQSISVANASNLYQRMSKTAMDEYGDFDVAYLYASGNGSGNANVGLKTYSTSGALTRSLTVDSRAGYNDYAPSLSMDYYGNAVVAWYGINGAYRNVYARQVRRTGSEGPTIAVTNTTSQALAPTVAVNPYSGSFVVTYTVGFSGSKVYEVEYSNTGASKATYYIPSPTTWNGSVSVDGYGHYFWTFTAQSGGGLTYVDAATGYLG
jgi:hypothetical protein